MAGPAAIPGPPVMACASKTSSGTLVNEFNGFLGTSTNNVAEYSGLLAALKYAQQHGHRAVRIKSDSELLVKQMRGEYKVKNAGLLPLYQQARDDCADARPHRVRARAARAQQGCRPTGESGNG